MARLFDNPVMLIALVVIIILLFGAPKLPGMARSLGQSMRIFKSEVEEMKTSDKSTNNHEVTTKQDDVVEGVVVDNKNKTV